MHPSSLEQGATRKGRRQCAATLERNKSLSFVGRQEGVNLKTLSEQHVALKEAEGGRN